MKEQFILTIKAEDRPGLLNQITGMLNRRQLAIESISAARTDISTVVMITIELIISEKAVNALTAKLENIIEVYAAEAVQSAEVICHQIAYFKLSKELLDSPQSAVLGKPGVQMINFYDQAIFIGKSGSEAEIRHLYNELEGPHLLGFLQSGLIAETSLIDGDEARVMVPVIKMNFNSSPDDEIRIHSRAA